MKYQVNTGSCTYWVDSGPSIPDTDVSITFKTQFDGASDPSELQNKFQMILNKDDLVRLGTHLIELGAA
jgi:hypothetical protein